MGLVHKILRVHFFFNRLESLTHVLIKYSNCLVIMLKFVLLVNKQGQTRLSQYYEYSTVEERVITEADIIRKCLARGDEQVTA